LKSIAIHQPRSFISFHRSYLNFALVGVVGVGGERSGFGFNWITCANYTFEIYGWFFFNVATQSLMGFLFMMAGALQVRVSQQLLSNTRFHAG
jgi:hypothetical protein